MNSKIALCCLFAAAFIALFAQNVSALPYPEEVAIEYIDPKEFTEIDVHTAAHVADAVAHDRQKRATCDLLSFAGVNHSACAAHCILRGKRGGYCNNHAVCVCRR